MPGKNSERVQVPEMTYFIAKVTPEKWHLVSPEIPSHVCISHVCF